MCCHPVPVQWLCCGLRRPSPRPPGFLCDRVLATKNASSSRKVECMLELRPLSSIELYIRFRLRAPISLQFSAKRRHLQENVTESFAEESYHDCGFLTGSCQLQSINATFAEVKRGLLLLRGRSLLPFLASVLDTERGFSSMQLADRDTCGWLRVSWRSFSYISVSQICRTRIVESGILQSTYVRRWYAHIARWK